MPKRKAKKLKITSSTTNKHPFSTFITRPNPFTQTIFSIKELQHHPNIILISCKDGFFLFDTINNITTSKSGGYYNSLGDVIELSNGEILACNSNTLYLFQITSEHKLMEVKSAVISKYNISTLAIMENKDNNYVIFQQNNFYIINSKTFRQIKKEPHNTQSDLSDVVQIQKMNKSNYALISVKNGNKIIKCDLTTLNKNKVVYSQVNTPSYLHFIFVDNNDEQLLIYSTTLLILFSLQTYQTITNLQLSNAIHKLHITSNKLYCILSHSNGYISIYNLNTFTLLHNIKLSEIPIHCIHELPNDMIYINIDKNRFRLINYINTNTITTINIPFSKDYRKGILISTTNTKYITANSKQVLIILS